MSKLINDVIHNQYNITIKSIKLIKNKLSIRKENYYEPNYYNQL